MLIVRLTDLGSVTLHYIIIWNNILGFNVPLTDLGCVTLDYVITWNNILGLSVPWTELGSVSWDYVNNMLGLYVDCFGVSYLGLHYHGTQDFRVKRSLD